MIIFYLMVAYVFLIGVISKKLVASGSITSKYNNNTNLFFAILIFALPVFFIGFRGYMGDTFAYIGSYEHLSADFPVLEDNIFKTRGYGWQIYLYILKNIFHLSSDWFLMVTAIFQAGALIKLYYKFSPDYSFSVLLFFLSMTFTQMMNGLRQFFAICLVIYFAEWIFKKKYFRFLLVVLIAVSIHNAAIVWAVAIFLIHGKPANIRMILFGFVILLSIVFVDRFTNILEDSLTETVYTGYTNQFAFDDGSNIAHTLIAFVPLVLAFVGRDQLAKSEDKITGVLINISILEAMTSLLANFTSGILIGRMAQCFSAFSFALYPRLFQQGFDAKNAKTLRVLCVLGYLAYFIYYLFYTKAGYHSLTLGLNI